MQLTKTENFRHRNVISELTNAIRGIAPTYELCNLVLACVYDDLIRNARLPHFESGRIVKQNAWKYIDEITLKKKFDPILSNLSKDEIKYLLLYLIKNKSEFGYRFDDSSSEEISKLVISLLEIKRRGGYTYCDVGCGRGSFLLSLIDHFIKTDDEPKDIFGVECNINDAAIAQVMVDIFWGSYSMIVNDDALKDGLNRFPPYQKAFCFPPFGMRVSNVTKSRLFNYEFSPRNSAEVEFIDLMLSRLIGNGLKAVALVPGRVFINSSDSEYIKKLIEAGWVEGIIELPQGALKFTGIKTYLIVFNPEATSVKLLDTNEFIKVESNFRNFVLPYEEIYQKYLKVKPISVDKIIKSNSFEPSKYKLSTLANTNGVQLDKIAEIFPGCKYTISNLKPYISETTTNYRFITSSNILEDTIDWKNLQFLKVNDDKFEKYCIHKNDIIMTSKSSKTKIAVITEEPKENTVVTGGMIIIRPDVKKINPQYLAMYLRSSKGQISIMSIQKGNTLIFIPIAGVSKLIIPMESIEKQNQLARKYEYSWETYSSLKKELDKLQSKLKNFFDEEQGDK